MCAPTMPRMTAGPAPGGAAGPASSPPRPAGLVLTPFRALRYDPAVAGDLSVLTSPPYDVLDDSAVRALEATSDWNVVRLILPRDEPNAGRDRYAAAADRLTAWRAAGVLRPDPVPALYVYEQADPAPGGHAQRGIVGALQLSPPEDGIVLPHESTMAGPVAGRLRLYDAVGGDLEPIFLVYDGGGGASQAVADADRTAPIVDALLADGLRHRVWALTDPGVLDTIAQDLAGRRALIADGHHRYATYLRRQQARHAAGAGPGPWDTGMCLLVDATAFGPQVHPIHRVLPGRPAADLAAALKGVAWAQHVGTSAEQAFEALSGVPADEPAFVLADQVSTHLVRGFDRSWLERTLPADRSPAWRALDVAVLHAAVVPSRWHLRDDEATVGYAHDVPEALAAARSSAGTAVLLRATPVAAVAAVAAAAERMPRKSTLFTPKPASGVLLRDHRDA